MITEEQLDYFGRVQFIRGVMAERWGLIGSPRGLISEYDFELMKEWMRAMEELEDCLCRLVG